MPSTPPERVLHARSKSSPVMMPARSVEEPRAQFAAHTTDDMDERLQLCDRSDLTFCHPTDCVSNCNAIEVFESIFPSKEEESSQIRTVTDGENGVPFLKDEVPNTIPEGSPCYQKRGRFLVWPVSMAGPMMMGIPIFAEATTISP
jgi:hypothetical protein